MSKVSVELELDGEVWETLDIISEHSGVCRDDVIAVMLVTKLLQQGVL